MVCKDQQDPRTDDRLKCTLPVIDANNSQLSKSAGMNFSNFVYILLSRRRTLTFMMYKRFDGRLEKKCASKHLICMRG